MSGNKIGQSKVHLIGVGGIGMSGIAEILVGFGAKVSGSDISTSERTKRLESLGVKFFNKHEAQNLKDVDIVVYSSAIKSENPELLKARDLEIPVISRAEALAELMRAKRGIAIAGTHGKTTTTSMISQVFESAEKSPTVVSGGIVVRLNTNAKLGSGEWFIAEADESDGSFDKLSPEISVITNIDNDHISHYGSYQNLIDSFFKFADKIPFYGSLVYYGDDEDCKKIFSKFPKKAISYGFSEDNEFQIRNIKGEVYKVFHREKELGEFTSPLPGDHNALNSLAAIVVGLRAGIPFDTVKEGIEDFSGVRRRFEIKADFEKEDLIIIDDYAHHPTEISAVLSACKKKYLGSRIRCVFQPHRYSRLKSCWDQFKTAFDIADELILLPVYPAGEEPLEGYNSVNLAEQVTQGNVQVFKKDFQSVSSTILDSFKSGDLVITLGAGDVYKLAETLKDNFKK